MVIVFWDREGVPFVNFMLKGTTMYSKIKLETLRKLKGHTERDHHHWETTQGAASALQCQVTHTTEAKT